MKTDKKNAYALEDRTLKFAGDVRAFVKELPRSVANREDSGQERRDALYQEACELMLILSSIMRKVQD